MNTSQRAALAQRYETDGMAGSCPQKLLLAVFDRLRADLETAASAIEAGEVESAHRRLLNAQDLVHELDIALEVDVWEGGNQLRTLYRHLLATMMEANLVKSVDLVRDCLRVVVPLQESWNEAYQILHP